MTSWLLVMMMHYDRSASVVTVPNLATSAECIRVAESVKRLDSKHLGELKCVEVYNSKGRS